MRNWSVDKQYLKKYPNEYKRWKHEQLLNFGIDQDDKLDVVFLKKNIDNLDVEEDTKQYVKFLLRRWN
jgi:hypothetical protein